MAFWKRKKDKQTAEPSSAAAVAARAAALGPEPPAPQAPLRLALQRADAPLIELDALEPGALTLEELAFRPISVPGLVQPFVNPKQPDLFGTPNWVFEYFLETLRDASVLSVEDFEKLLVVWRGPESPHFAFIYADGGKVLPVWFESDQLFPWLSTLGGFFEGPCEIEAKLSGYKSRKSAFDDQSDLAEFLQLNAASSEEADPPNSIETKPSPTPAAATEPVPVAVPPVTEPPVTVPPLKSDASTPGNSLDETAAKRQWLDEALAANNRHAEVDPAAVVATWRTLIEATGAEPNPPVSDAEIVAFETTTGLTLPAELAAMLRAHNGAKGAFGMMSAMGLDQILAQWQGWKQIFDEWPLDELLHGYSSPAEEALGAYTTPRWIPLVDERTGNFAALDLAPGPQGSHGQIIYFGADESHSIRVLATDLDDFLSKQLAYARAEIDQHGDFSSQESACFYLN